ncbi:hypothetical protein J4Q44_G00194020 [Coregonus suidteri]|uniref:Uncharacterized protein n=1 Tax=Coregonus suidteri TaxID=861788 RepID=A0AAN8LSI3_9TELE
MICLYKHHLDWTQLDKRIFLRKSGSFATKRVWTSHALHQRQGQDRNRLSEYRFPCSCMVRTDQLAGSLVVMSVVPVTESSLVLIPEPTR